MLHLGQSGAPSGEKQCFAPGKAPFFQNMHKIGGSEKSVLKVGLQLSTADGFHSFYFLTPVAIIFLVISPIFSIYVPSCGKLILMS